MCRASRLARACHYTEGLVVLSPLAPGHSLCLKASSWKGTHINSVGGLVLTDGLQNERVCGCGLSVQVHHRSYCGITVANTELPIHVSTCGRQRMKHWSATRERVVGPSLASEPGHFRAGPGVKSCVVHSALPGRGGPRGSDEGVGLPMWA